MASLKEMIRVGIKSTLKDGVLDPINNAGGGEAAINKWRELKEKGNGNLTPEEKQELEKLVGLVGMAYLLSSTKLGKRFSDWVNK